MKIDLGGGAYLEPDTQPRKSRFHFDIVNMERLPNTLMGFYAVLSCGHRVMMFGNMEMVGRRAFCAYCRDEERRGLEK